MAKRKPIPPYLTLPNDAIHADPVEGWELLVDDNPDRVVGDKDLFPSWDSSLSFILRRRFVCNPQAFDDYLEIPSAHASYQFIVRLETASGLLSQVVFKKELGPDDSTVEVLIAPDSRWLSKDIAVACSLVVASVRGHLGALSPSRSGSRVWSQTWSAKLEGGRTRLPIEIISFRTQLHDLAIQNALLHVSVADDPQLEFEQAVCVYLNSDHPRFITDFERGEKTATAMVWDSVVRQVLSAGLSEAFDGEGEAPPEGSFGAQLAVWIESIFPGESRRSLCAMRRDNPGLFEGRVQSWVNAAAFWSGDESK